MTPAELLAWAAHVDEKATTVEMYPCAVPVIKLADLRLAARLARFAADRGGLEQESNGKA